MCLLFNNYYININDLTVINMQIIINTMCVYYLINIIFTSTI